VPGGPAVQDLLARLSYPWAGRQRLADAGPLLAGADALRRRVVRAARGPGSFTIGFMPGLIVTGAVRALAGRHPQLTVNVLRTSWDDQTAVLHDGRADVSYIRLPADQSGLQVRALLRQAPGRCRRPGNRPGPHPPPPSGPGITAPAGPAVQPAVNAARRQ